MTPRAVIVTRTRPGTQRSLDGVAALGAIAVASPAAQVIRSRKAFSAKGRDAIAFTSANAVESLVRPDLLADLPVFAVGAGTALAAREAGFTRVEESAGDAEALARFIASRLPEGSRITHFSGEDRAGDLAGMLAVLGFEVTTETVYRTRLARGLTRAAQEALRAPGTLVLIHSARGAERFLRLIAEAGEDALLPGLGFVVISDRAAVPLYAAGLDAQIAAEPTEDSLMAALASVLADQER
ncbi:uroporphyrinogen-III synthase [Glycocaulis sp.]|uniref:uroporphyrinogen-III synthase n=1 Tax=Glycocaulis sp. TaxID=1969725 RepID=UPI0025BE27B7|nr:uroporphyrinogen-III synthase [Glycocaulis sp.]MCH8520911.1 uroporphyrinogen-III synthase [Glycocaulis sp.]